MKLSVQTFYQPLFSNSFPFQKLPTPKSSKAKSQSQKTPKAKVLKAKALRSPSAGLFIPASLNTT
jgi:hypothetical protein